MTKKYHMFDDNGYDGLRYLGDYTREEMEKKVKNGRYSCDYLVIFGDEVSEKEIDSIFRNKKTSRFDEYGNYGENNPPVRDTEGHTVAQTSLNPQHKGSRRC